MKKLILAISAAAASMAAAAQNVQLHYDLGHDIYRNGERSLAGRAALTSTVEFFRPDRFGSTFFFIDLDYSPNAGKGVTGAYWEISRELCFWQDTPADWLSVHVEYDGGCDIAGGSYDDAWLGGLTYSGHSGDFSRTWSLSAMYKAIPKAKNLDGQSCPHSFQLTGVWEIGFARGWCTFSGFVDFWREPRAWQGTEYITLAEPQLWVNLDAAERMKAFHLSLGTEVRTSFNFVGAGFYAIPTAALKWSF